MRIHIAVENEAYFVLGKHGAKITRSASSQSP
jgi:hypothetical protein